MNKLSKGNGGWSTKAKGIDRRKNPFQALNNRGNLTRELYSRLSNVRGKRDVWRRSERKALPRVYSRQTNAERGYNLRRWQRKHSDNFFYLSNRRNTRE